MGKLINIMILVDPSREVQPALERFLATADQRKDVDKVTLFIAPDYELLGRSRKYQTMRRDQNWVSEFGVRLAQQGVQYETYYSWEVEWASSVKQLVKSKNIDTLMVSVFQDNAGENLLSSEMWDVLRSAMAKTLFIREGQSASSTRRNILAGIKIQDEALSKLNNRVLAELKYAADISKTDTFVANAYESSSTYPDRAKLIEFTGLENDHLVVEQKAPDVLIAEAVEKCDADLIIIGIRQRRTVKELLRGKTIERILKTAQCDLVAVH